MHLTDEVSKIKNVGEARQLLLQKIKIFTIYDLISYYPRTYDDRSKLTFIEEIEDAMRVSIKVTIKNKAENYKINGLNITKVKCFDETGASTLVWFNQPYLKNVLEIGTEYLVYGKVVFKNAKTQIDVIEFEKATTKKLDQKSSIVPIYTLPKGLSQKVFRGLILNALEQNEENIKEYFDLKILGKYNLKTIDFATKNIHFPDDNNAFYLARERLVFDEFFLMQGALYNIKGFAKKKTGIIFEKTNWSEFEKNLKYNLTNAQKRVVAEIEKDFASGKNMNRLVQGDVGSGKTVVAMICAYIVIKNGFQSVIMAPTEVLANQHFYEIEKFFSLFGIKTVILSGSMKKSERDKNLKQIENGEAQMIVGTHALIQDRVKFLKLGLSITDEQHRFGVRQRGVLNEKGDLPHMLVMTATPIPRTLGLILYGDLDISIIDEMPPGRQKIDTFVVNTSYRQRIYNFIKKEVENNCQVYVICPAIEENEKATLVSVIKYCEDLQEYFKNDKIKIEYLHGKMKQVEKEGIMSSFKENNINVLVSTTVIEVGINVPNATLIIIEDSHRFGLSQLHQLRGRVGRGKKKSYCILVSDAKSKLTKKRLKAMEMTNDGFVLSEEDLKLRGHGDFFGNRQHGLPEYKIANLYEDTKTLKKCQDLWESIFENENNLKNNDIIRLKIDEYVNLTKNTVYL